LSAFWRFESQTPFDLAARVAQAIDFGAVQSPLSAVLATTGMEAAATNPTFAGFRASMVL